MEEETHSNTTRMRWEDLDPNILKEIFSRIPLDDLFMKASYVCRSWQSATWDFLFWSRNELDLDFVMAAFNKNLKNSGEYQMAGKLSKLLKHIMEGNDAYGNSLGNWRLSIHTIIIPCDLELSDDHLLYLAERTPGLKHLSLLATHKVTVEGFAKVIQNWKSLKSIHLGPLKHKKWYSQIMQEIGRNCKEIEELYMHNTQVYIDDLNPLAMDIVRNLPGLKRLGFKGSPMDRKGILIFINQCPQLQEIDVSDCLLPLRRLYYGLSTMVNSSFCLERRWITDDDYIEGLDDNFEGLVWCVKYSADPDLQLLLGYINFGFQRWAGLRYSRPD